MDGTTISRCSSLYTLLKRTPTRVRYLYQLNKCFVKHKVDHVLAQFNYCIVLVFALSVMTAISLSMQHYMAISYNQGRLLAVMCTLHIGHKREVIAQQFEETIVSIVTFQLCNCCFGNMPHHSAKGGH